MDGGMMERLMLPPGGLRVPVKAHHKLYKEFADLRIVQVSRFGRHALVGLCMPWITSSRAGGFWEQLLVNNLFMVFTSRDQCR